MRNSDFQTVVIRWTMLRKCPDWVRITALVAWAKPAPKNKTASRSAPATILHFTQAERAMARRDKIEIHINEERTRLPTIQRLFQVQLDPARLACTANRTMPGIHVICDNRIARTDALPATYSARENGRQKYNGSAPFARSGAISPGPVNAVSTNASVPCTFMKKKKNLLSILM